MKKLIALAVAGLLLLASPLSAQTNFQYYNTPWQAYAPRLTQCGAIFGLNMNTTADQPITISIPTALWMVGDVIITNPSISLTTASGGLYSGAGKTGVAIIGNTAMAPLTTPTASTTGNAYVIPLSTAGTTTSFPGLGQPGQVKTLYFALTTAQGAAATADIRIACRPLFGSSAAPN